ncbi:hypothetical protein M0R45_005738 [Rubus argutus]|uniref:Uncharacterized protein n=1 Tax=Rubus argutus TaxID=59490 RepID=A0AAW1YNG8_RUBAR
MLPACMACKPKAARRGPKNEVYKVEGNLVGGNTGDQNGVFNVGNENSGCSRVADDDHEEDEAPSMPKAASSGPENLYYEVKGIKSLQTRAKTMEFSMLATRILVVVEWRAMTTRKMKLLISPMLQEVAPGTYITRLQEIESVETQETIMEFSTLATRIDDD